MNSSVLLEWGCIRCKQSVSIKCVCVGGVGGGGGVKTDKLFFFLTVDYKHYTLRHQTDTTTLLCYSITAVAMRSQNVCVFL